MCVVGKESHLELVDFIEQMLFLLFESHFAIVHVTLRFIIRLLEYFQITVRLLQKSSLIPALNGDMVYECSCGTPHQLR